MTGEEQRPPLAADIWHRQLAAGRSGDWAALETILAADCVWAVMMQGAAFRGRDEVISFIREGFDAAATRNEPEVRNEFSSPQWGVYEYTSRGTVDRNRATVFAKRLTGGRPIISGAVAHIIGRVLAGKAFAIPVCFVYHVNADGLIDQVNEYVGKRTTHQTETGFRLKFAVPLVANGGAHGAASATTDWIGRDLCVVALVPRKPSGIARRLTGT